MSLPVERSITVSAPKWTAMCSFSSSSSTLLVTAELPMLALILHVAAMPMPIGSSRPARCTLFAGMTIRPAATSSRISFRREVLALGDEFHFRRDLAGTSRLQVE